MTELEINDTYIKQINIYDPLKVKIIEVLNVDNIVVILNHLHKFVNLQVLILSGLDEITEITGLNDLVNLQVLDLSFNKITRISYLDNLVNLQKIDLSFNDITEIIGLNNLVNLQVLDLHDNKIKEITGLNNLVNLQVLNLSNNKITEITGLNNLVNLQKLNLNDNQITVLPLSLCNFRNLIKFSYYANPIEHISVPVHRWLERLNRRVTVNNMVYNDGQNIHNHHIQSSFKNSLDNLLKDQVNITLDAVKQQILDCEILTEQSKRELLNYCDDLTEHSTYLITYSDLLIYVWSRIIKHEHSNEILKVLNQEISDGLCMCFTGRLTRLLNVLVGFYDDIELQISDSEQITNIIMSLKNKFAGEELRNELKKELLDRQYSETIINEWLEYI